MEDSADRKVSREVEEGTVKPARSFRYEDYNTRRVFLRSYPLQWDWSPSPDDEKQGLGAAADGPVRTKNCSPYGCDGNDHQGDECCGASKRWRVAMVEWGEDNLDKLVLLRRAKKRLAMYLLGCHHGRPALPFRSGGSATAAMLASR